MFKKKIQALNWNTFFKFEEETMTAFRIIPHASVLNNQSQKLWRSLHVIYSGILERFSREGEHSIIE